MDAKDLLAKLLQAENIINVEGSLSDFEQEFSKNTKWKPIGNKENNSGPINVATDQGRSLVERVTNGIDAILELEHDKHSGLPDCRSPKQAASSWLNVPTDGLTTMSIIDRRTLAHRVQIRVREGEGKESRVVEVRDDGTGIAAVKMPDTILSLNESNKMQKHYLAGVYGQGGSSTFALSKYTLIASSYIGSKSVSFTIVKYLDLPADNYKTGSYVYLTVNDSVMQADLESGEFGSGTLVKHFGYDLSNYSNPFGPYSVYGLLNYILFDPVLPVWLEDKVHNVQRTIKGSRNALNGAAEEDEEKEEESNYPEKISHHMSMFYVSIGDFGRVGIEYWVLKPRKKPSGSAPNAAYTNPIKPVIMTQNGQNHGELNRQIIKKEAELPYLTPRFIGHIDCNNLSPQAKRFLFASSREDTKHGTVYGLIEQEFIKALKSDDELKRLNNEARENSIKERDEDAIKNTRTEVAKILKVYGFDVTGASSGDSGNKDGTKNEPIHRPPRPPRPIKVIQLNEPPTYIKILWDDSPITLYHGQRRYIRVETDANSTYHDPKESTKSKVNIITTVKLNGSTPLQEGRMRIIVEGDTSIPIGEMRKLRIELTRAGLSTLFDEHEIKIVSEPPAKPSDKKLTIPKFRVVPIDPKDTMWTTLEWPQDTNVIASEAVQEQDELVIYYSTEFPSYINALNKFSSKNQTLADSFKKRYETWIAVHSLLIENGKKTNIPSKEKPDDDSNTNAENYERAERCRIAVVSTLFASKEVKIEGVESED